MAVWNTFRFTAVCLPLLVGLGLLAAVQLSRLRNNQRFKTLFLFPMAVPAAAIVLVWKMVFSSGGFLNLLLGRLGLLADGAQRIIWPQEQPSGCWCSVMCGKISAIRWCSGCGSFFGAGQYSGGCPGGRGVPVEMLLEDHPAESEREPVHDHGTVFSELLQGIPGGLSGGGFLSRQEHVSASAFVQQLFVNLDLDKMAAAAVCVGMVLFGAILILQGLWDRED